MIRRRTLNKLFDLYTIHTIRALLLHFSLLHHGVQSGLDHFAGDLEQIVVALGHCLRLHPIVSPNVDAVSAHQNGVCVGISWRESGLEQLAPGRSQEIDRLLRGGLWSH